MKLLIKNNGAKYILLLSMVCFSILSCQKEIKLSPNQEEYTVAENNILNQGHLKQTKTFSAEVVISWLNMQLDMLRVPLPAGTGTQAPNRAMGYCGIAAYEAVLPGMPAYQSLSGQLNGFPEMPKTEPGKAYHWAASANAALAQMNRKLFPTTSLANKAKINDLENTLMVTYATEVNDATLQRSIIFGREVADRVFAWAATDGSANVNPPYVPPVGPGLWVSTPPNFPSAANPYSSQVRLMVPGVTNGTALVAPPAYSTDHSSAYFAMAKDVYDKSQALTPAQRALAIYYRDVPGYPGGGFYVSLISEVLSEAEPMLDIAALVYVKTGIASFDAISICFVNKYNYNVERPITYIRNVMGYTGWNALFNTPGHPEFPSAHAVNGMAITTMLTNIFGENYHITLHTYDYLGLPARSYNSFYEMSKDISDSRVYGGIHYQASCDKGLLQGKKIAENILNKLKFLKE